MCCLSRSASFDAQVDPTKIHLYKSNNCDEHEKWQHVPFNEREKEIPHSKAPVHKSSQGKNVPYYRKFMSSPTKKNVGESTGAMAKGSSQGSKISSM